MATRDPEAQASLIAESQLQTQLLDQYGPLLSGRNLSVVLGFPSPAAFRQALKRGTLPVPVFEIANRRGRFALTQEVGAWLAACRAQPLGSTSGAETESPTVGTGDAAMT